MLTNIGIIDYGMGNLHSVSQAFKRLNTSFSIVKQPSDLNKCTALVLPGVGSFDPAMSNLNETKLIPNIQNWAKEGKPFLGICLGLQLLFDTSEEGKCEGLGIIKGKVKKLPIKPSQRIPHMGWGNLIEERSCPLFNKSKKQNWVYFVHSYSAEVANKKELSATVPYEDFKITAIVWKDNIGACQFHPEKSGKAGERMLSNWLDWMANNN